ncbi:MAG: cell surface protein SprA [Tannerellaceae bacterium]|nr:cell surface protein SprA [Tannerellaceae bacterium]
MLMVFAFALGAGYAPLIDEEAPWIYPAEDTIPKLHTEKTYPEEYLDLVKSQPPDLKTPENVKTTVEYDIKSGNYIFRTRIGDLDIGTPLMLTPDEYRNYDMQQSLRSYFRKKNQEEFEAETGKEFNIADMQFDYGSFAERIFGKGGVRLRPQGSADLKMGLKRNSTENPSLPERARSRTFFQFDQDLQFNVQASVGTKLRYNMNYNTETSFDFDTRQLRLAYGGEEDEIIKSLEAGNVSMKTNNSLIRGGSSLFGVKADLQFGKLRLYALLAQQESQSQSVKSKGGAQTKSFEVSIDQYDENRHFFLSHYFRDNYDYALEKLPFIRSAVTINRVEVWITNKRSNFNQARNIVAFTDMGERRVISNSSEIRPSGSVDIPYNNANNLYSRLLDEFADARESSRVNQALGGTMQVGRDYEKIENARLLPETDYTVNRQLGYISLNTILQPDEVLAVAYDFQYNGEAYKVGEFAADNADAASSALFVKLLKGTAMSPGMTFWDLMMKNVYELPEAYGLEKDRFRLDILYQNDTTGAYLNYISEGEIKDQILLKVMNLDRLDRRNEPYPDGFYDFVEGITVQPQMGRIVFPVVEPFGSHLRKMIGPAAADKYVFQELYDSTLNIAAQIAEKNKFILRGEFKASSSSSEIRIGSGNVARGSVRVTAGGQLLAENVDYIVDYSSNVVTIINEGVLASGAPINVELESRSLYNRQRKTMVGLDLAYQFSKDFSVGGTIMHLSEMPVTVKTSFGVESVRNTLWGLNTSFKTESQWLTNMLDKIPLLSLTAPSQISFNAEFAHLIAGHYENKYTGKYSYLDDFETTQSGFDLRDPYPWNLSAVPFEDGSAPRFPEAAMTNSIEYGKNRALLAWYHIDGLFTRPNSTQAPAHIKRDKNQLSNHYIRAVRVDELFPNRNLTMNEANTLQTLNVTFYPNSRGPYNLDADGITPDGALTDPEKRWGGMMRKIDQSDFEKANIEYIEFWMLNPFIYKPGSSGGDLYFNLGEVSEDILKDEKKFFENGLPIDGDTAKVDYTVWGKVPRQQSTVYAFDNAAGARRIQDVGFNGLSSLEEAEYPAYRDYLVKLQSKLSPDALQPFLDDPAGDNFRHYRGADLDRDEVNILERYKYYNGTEGNSAASEGQTYNMAARISPDVEDLNQDNTMNENERYFQYRISLRPEDMQVGHNYIVGSHETTVKLENGTPESVTWYQFKIPVRQYSKAVGNIRDFKTIRFMRMYLTGFRDTTFLRFGSFELVKSEWRTYTQDLSNPSAAPSPGASLDVSSVNIEENNSRKPVNYVLPPGVTRMVDPGQPQLVQQNEQALSLKVTNLGSQDARAVYKSAYYDMRQYKRMQLFTHAESFIGDNVTRPADNELSVFIRLGSDYKNNYYEYEVPLRLTPHKDTYNTYVGADQEAVWPIDNMLDFRLEALTNLKTKRNRDKRMGVGGVAYHIPYSDFDPDHARNKISVVGNPTLSEVKIIMVGVRNNARDARSAEVWINELRLTEFHEEGGWAANGNMSIALSDLGTVNLTGRVETAGFGGLEQSVNDRRLDDYTQYSVAANFELGKFFPEKAKVSIPLYYAYSKEIVDPKYNPLDQDISLEDALADMQTQAERDSILAFAREKVIVKSISVNNVKVDIRSKNPMPYDPANFSLGYAFSENNRFRPDVEYETTKDYRGNFTYNYNPYATPFRPFAKLSKSNGATQYIKQLSINYLPASIGFQTSMMRNYYEIQMRNLNNIGQSPQEKRNLLSFSQNFLWDRAFNLAWNFTNNLRANFRSGTNARIEEPHVQVNKKLNPDQYQLWRDSVQQSITELGRPLRYDQEFSASYTMPFIQIPALNWINAQLSYTSTYNWDKGAIMEGGIEIGNTIKNQSMINIQPSINFTGLYNKSKYLSGIHQKYANANRAAIIKKPNDTKLERTITLSPDSATILEHGMLTKDILVNAKTTAGKTYRIRFKPVDYARIRIENRDTATLNLTLSFAPPKGDNILKKAAEQAIFFTMMLKTASIAYQTSSGMNIPGYRPEIGGMFGQGQSTSGLAPGIGFAFGNVSRNYIAELANKDWLVMNTNNITPAIINNTRNLTLNASLEPLPGLKINLNAMRNETRRNTIQYMYNGMPELRDGSFSMHISAISTAFAGIGTAADNYASKTFQTFLDNRAVIAQRLENAYSTTRYPNAGFLRNTSLAGQPYNSDLANGRINHNSADVLIPAFIAAYTGRNPGKNSLAAFPALSSLVPAWTVTYDGLMRIPIIKQYLKTLVLNHRYQSTYQIGAYSSLLNWVSTGGDNGFVQDPQSGNPTPSSPYSIASVAISESFSPLIGADGTLPNNLSFRLAYDKIRTLNLNISSFQLVESSSDKFTVGLGYTLTEFNKVLKMKPAQDFSNDLTIRLDYSYAMQQALIRKIQDASTQATSGNVGKTLQFSADYGMSRLITLRAYYNLQINTPLISSASFPTSNSDYGISLRLSLTQ